MFICDYVEHNRKLIYTYPSIVIRVITRMDYYSKIIYEEQTWLEIPSKNGLTIYLDNLGNYLPIYKTLDSNQQNLIKEIRELISKQSFELISDCIENSKKMHKKIPPINCVAWDWIPSDPKPTLLEGNSGFSNLIPNLFKIHRGEWE